MSPFTSGIIMRADRLLSILMQLQAQRKMTASKLAVAVGVSRRTILRDIEALSIAGIPIYTEGGRGGGIGLDEDYQLALTGIPVTEVSALFVSGVTSVLSDVNLDQNAENTLTKVLAALPSPHQQAVEQIRLRLHVDPAWWGQEAEPLPFWADLQKAVFDDFCVMVTYEKRAGEIVKRMIEPYSLVVKGGMWYLVARHDDQFRTYRVSRFRTVTLTKTHFQRHADFDLAAHWNTYLEQAKNTFSDYKCTLRLTAKGLEFLKQYRPANSELLDVATEDGSYTVEVSLGSLASAKMLVFGLDAEVVVIEPIELLEAVVSTARRIVASEHVR